MTKIANEKLLRAWAIAAMLVVVLVALTPLEILEAAALKLSPPPLANLLAGILVAGTILVLVLGFHLLMLYECGFDKEIRHRTFWMTTLILIPLLSAFAYYWITRSKTYHSRTSMR